VRRPIIKAIGVVVVTTVEEETIVQIIWTKDSGMILVSKTIYKFIRFLPLRRISISNSYHHLDLLLISWASITIDPHLLDPSALLLLLSGDLMARTLDTEVDHHHHLQIISIKDLEDHPLHIGVVVAVGDIEVDSLSGDMAAHPTITILIEDLVMKEEIEVEVVVVEAEIETGMIPVLITLTFNVVRIINSVVIIDWDILMWVVFLRRSNDFAKYFKLQ
jgi:hypothetical protein